MSCACLTNSGIVTAALKVSVNGQLSDVGPFLDATEIMASMFFVYWSLRIVYFAHMAYKLSFQQFEQGK